MDSHDCKFIAVALKYKRGYGNDLVDGDLDLDCDGWTTDQCTGIENILFYVKDGHWTTSLGGFGAYLALSDERATYEPNFGAIYSLLLGEIHVNIDHDNEIFAFKLLKEF